MAIGLIGIRLGHTPPGGGGGGSYDNLANWPSSANRPQFNHTTKVLSWTGPEGGGPSTSADTPQTRLLTSSSSVTTTADGQVIEGLYILDGQITIAHKNVTVRQCYVGGHASSSQDIIQIYQNSTSLTGLVVEDCDLNGNADLSSSGGGNISGAGAAVANMTVRRCSLHDSEQGVRYVLTNVTIEDCWFYDPMGIDADQVELYAGSNNVTISHNSFGPNVGHADSYYTGWNSSINLSTYSSGSVTGITVDGNRFCNNPTFHTLLNDNQWGNTTAASYTNNSFFNCANVSWSAADGTCSPNSGNYVPASIDDTSGTPINGTGAI